MFYVIIMVKVSFGLGRIMWNLSPVW